MANLTLVQAVNLALIQEMEKDDRVLLLGEDIGLNGGGWHTHKRGGKLNTHLDYSLHTKLKLERKLNIINYKLI